MREPLRKVAREARLAALASLGAVGGLNFIAGSRWRARRLLILCYHGVSMRDEHVWNGRLFASPEFMRRRFEILRDGGYRVLPLGEAVAALRNGTLPSRAVSITFDDGFHNFYSKAVPLLEEFGFPATNYVSSYYCLHQRPVPNVAMRYLLWRMGDRVLPPGTLPGQVVPIHCGNPVQREKWVQILIKTPRVVAGGEEAQQAQLADVARRLGIDFNEILREKLFHLMTPEEVTQTAKRGFDIQLHTHRHRTPRDRTAFVREITENRQLLEEMSGRPAKHFCYPSGDVDMMFLPWLRETGVETATTTGEAGLASATDDPLLLPRFVDTMAQPESMFRGWLSGAGTVLRRHAT